MQLKTGHLSFYNFSNYLGASFFSDTYYIQFDFFSIISILLSFFMNFEMAFGITELLKLFLGTLLFGYFLYLRKCSNKAILVASLIYFVCGYNSVMMAFSGFFSLVFYYPFAAICLEKYKSGHKYLLPLCSAILVFYNFYLGACTMLFMGMWFILSYFLDNKLSEIKDNILKVNPNCKYVTLKAVLIYLGKGFVSGIICALYMIVGIMIATIILLPSISFFLSDSFPRNDNYYMWSFDAKEGYSRLTMVKMFARILGNLFTPTYSTDFYGFINDYITDHNSLFMTITGLMILLFVFKLKDRESKIFKIALVFEVLLLLFPFTYMLFSLNKCPYTRWFGMLNFLNIMVIGHVITKTDFRFNFLSAKSLVTNAILLCFIVIVLNYYLKNVYGASIIEIFKGKKMVLNEKLEDMASDIVMMIVAIGIVIVITALSGQKLQSKFNVMPYIIAFEMVISFGFMFIPKAENYNTYWYAEHKDMLNKYMNKNLKNPYESGFYRTYVKSFITDDYVNGDNYSRTNLYLSDLRVFHSFYDCNTNDLVKMYYDTSSASAETRNSKVLLNEYSLFYYQVLAGKYIVTDSTAYDEYNYTLPSDYFELVNDDGTFKTFENKNYSPFMIYDKKISESDYTAFYSHLAKQQYGLNFCSLTDSDYKDVMLEKGTLTNNVVTYSIDYDEELIDEEKNMVGYVIKQPGRTIPNKGVMHFYFYGRQSARSVTFKDVELEYEDGSRSNALSGYAYYDQKPKIIWIERTSSYNKLDEEDKDLRVEFADYSNYDAYVNRMSAYNDLKLTIDNNKLHLSYHRDDNNTNVVVLPISYNNCWKIDKDYKIIKTYGGLLGIVVPRVGNYINITLTFEARYLKDSALISICGAGIYMLVLVSNYRRLKKDEEDYNYCSMF